MTQKIVVILIILVMPALFFGGFALNHAAVGYFTEKGRGVGENEIILPSIVFDDQKSEFTISNFGETPFTLLAFRMGDGSGDYSSYCNEIIPNEEPFYIHAPMMHQFAKNGGSLKYWAILKHQGIKVAHGVLSYSRNKEGKFSHTQVHKDSVRECQGEECAASCYLKFE